MFLKDYLRAWTVTWVATFLISLRLSVKQGPLLVACTRAVRTISMLWELCSFLRIETCGETFSVVDLMSGGLLSAVACGGSFCIVSRYYSSVPAHFSENDGRDDKEKAAWGPRICEILDKARYMMAPLNGRKPSAPIVATAGRILLSSTSTGQTSSS